VHFAESATLNAEHASRAVHYLYSAARQASAGAAWSEAQRLYERAVVLLDSLPEQEQTNPRGDLLAELAVAAEACADFRVAWRALNQSLNYFRARGDGLAFATVAARHRESVAWAPTARLKALLEEAVDLLGGASDEIWARLIIMLYDPLAECEEAQFPVETARCHLSLAELAEQRGDPEAARTHLDVAGELFAQHGAKLYLDQVLAKKEILRA
jgi:hypothetical protein